MFKKFLQILSIVVLLAGVFFSGCRKTNEFVTSTNIKPDSASYVQYQVAVLTGYNITFKQPVYDGFLAGHLVKLTVYGNQLGFVVPDVTPGSYTLQTTVEGNQYLITINIKTIGTITSADDIIQGALQSSVLSNLYIDSLVNLTATMQGTNTTADLSNATMLKNLGSQIATDLNASSSDDKLYVAKLIKANPSLFLNLERALDIIDTNRLYRKTSATLEQKSDSVVSRVTNYLAVNSFAMLATKIIRNAPAQPAVAAELAEAVLADRYFDAYKSTIILVNEPIILSSFDLTSYYRTTLSNLTVTNAQPYTMELSGAYRNICYMDSISSSPLVTALDTAMKTFSTAWYNTSTVLPVPFSGSALYLSAITTAKTKTLAINPYYLSVGNISNPNLIANTDISTGKLKITFVTTQITTNQLFTFDITYTNPGLVAHTQTYNGTIPAQRTGKVVAGGNGLGSSLSQFYNPAGLWMGADGKLYVADQGNNRIVKWDTGGLVGTLVAGGNGVGDSINQFNSPNGVWGDGTGGVFVADRNNNRVMHWAYDSVKGIKVAGFATTSDSMLNAPAAVCYSAAGAIYVADMYNNRIQKWTPGVGVVTVAGGNGAGAAANQLHNPSAVFVDASGNVYIADSYNNRIQKWAPGATNGTTVAGGNGTGSGATQLINPSGLFVSASGDLYIADKGNSRIQKWAAGGNTGYTAAVGDCNSVFLDGAGNIYVANMADVTRWAPL